MEKIYKTKDGASFIAESAADLIAQLRACSFNPCANLAEYAEQTAGAAEIQTGKHHGAEPERLLADLIASGLVKEI